MRPELRRRPGTPAALREVTEIETGEPLHVCVAGGRRFGAEAGKSRDAILARPDAESSELLRVERAWKVRASVGDRIERQPERVPLEGEKKPRAVLAEERNAVLGLRTEAVDRGEALSRPDVEQVHLSPGEGRKIRPSNENARRASAIFSPRITRSSE